MKALKVFLFIFCITLMANISAKSAVDLFESGKVLQAKMDYYGAVECYQEALTLNPNYALAWLNMAVCSYYLGQYELATSYLEKAQKFSGNDTKIQNLKGFICIATGDIKAARDTFNEILKKTPNDVDARFGLAELDLYDGKLSGAQKLYEDALRRYSTSKKALLSLALLSSENKDFNTAEKYISVALQHHNDDAEVHYMAAYLFCQKGDFAIAESQVRSAIHLNNDYTKAYELLAQILFSQQRYTDVIDVCMFLLSRDRTLSTVWYLNGLALEKSGKIEDAITNYQTGLDIAPEDEVMRSSLELLVLNNLSIEDPRRATWSSFHTAKARDAMRRFDSVRARYEYNRALALNPYDIEARKDYNQILRGDGNYELYLEQLKFLKDHGVKANISQYDATIANDTLEAIESMMTYSLSRKWNVDPFYLDKNRWNIGIYYLAGDVQLLHPELSRVTCGMLVQIFNQVSEVTLLEHRNSVKNAAEAFAISRKNKQDFFIVISVDENTREITLNAKIYNGATGVQCNEYTVFRTGNNRYSNVMVRLRNNLISELPTRGKILSRKGQDVLLDLGKVDGVIPECVFDVVKAGYVKISDKDNKITYQPNSVLGQVKITQVGEEVSEGVFLQKGFYDRQNLGDEVVLVSTPKKEENSQEPKSALAKQVIDPTEDIGPEVPVVGRLPALLELIKNIQ